MSAKKSSHKKAKPRGLPSKEEIIAFIQNANDKIGKREIARAFNIKGDQRKDLKALLNEMTEEGLIAGNRKRFEQPGKLPSVAVLDIIGLDEHGDTFAKPVYWNSEEYGEAPKVLMKDRPGHKKSEGTDLPGVGSRILARITKFKAEHPNHYIYSAHIIRKLNKNTRRLLGIYKVVDNRGGIIEPIDKKQLREWPVPKGDEKEATDGELVRFETQKAGRFGFEKAKIIECLGNPDDQRAVSLIAIHAHGIRDSFYDDVLSETEELQECELGHREDLRNIPLITIDPADARDHDDAVWAQKDDDPTNFDGWIVYVAIADVASYVCNDTAIDIEARKRGNSTYFPDRVVPMLPERISNDLCSLRFGEDRPCLAVRMVFDKSGHKKGHRFIRGFMRSAAKLSYEQAQNAINGKIDEITEPLIEPILKPLWGAYEACQNARNKRAPLELDLPERKIILNKAGKVSEIRIPERLDAHKLIEEFMIQANVAAAEELEKHKIPFIYRVHDAPSEEKVIALSDFLATIDLKIAKGTTLRPDHFNKILQETKESAYSHMVSEIVLRTQSQAEYTPENAGHFGLNLRRYAHFTSPIRRYADLIVHRCLIRALGVGEDGITDAEIETLIQIAQEISDLERKSMAAERDTIDRLVSSYLSEHIGTNFSGRISGVTRSGLFVRLLESGADGFVPVATMANDYYFFDEARKSLVGEKTGLSYRLGEMVDVRLVEVMPSAGAIRFELLSQGKSISKKGANTKKKTAKRTTLRKVKKLKK